MRKKFLLLIAAYLVIILASCGMSQEQIGQSLSNLDNAYNSGTYDQAKEELTKLDKAYNKMSDEQKSKFVELRPLVDNAVANVSVINEGLNNAQSFYNQNMYYEAQMELDKLNGYQLPPVEKTKFDELQGNVSTAISIWEITEMLQKIETTYNSGDYDLALSLINGFDISGATAEQKQQYESLRGKIDNSRLLVQSEGEYTNGKYNTSLNTLSTINTTYLTENQFQRYIILKSNAEAAKRRAESTISQSQAKQLVMNYYRYEGCQSVQCYAQDGNYYYIRAFMTESYSFVLGECRVDKKTGRIQEI